MVTKLLLSYTFVKSLRLFSYNLTNFSSLGSYVEFGSLIFLTPLDPLDKYAV